MYASDFIFDGINLSSFGCVICDFEGSTGVEEVEAGAPLNFKTVSTRKGNRFPLIDVGYDNALEVTFDICKDPCAAATNEAAEITDTEYLALMRWLVRNQFLTIRFLDDRLSMNRYYNGAFSSVIKLTIDSRLYGLRLTFVTDRPYALGASISSTHEMTSGTAWNYEDTSHLTGTIIPDLEITLHAAGTLRLTNQFTGKTMVITDCTSGEKITFYGDSLTMFSTNTSKNIWNRFNYEFFKIGNRIGNSVNQITSSLDCTLKITYRPIIKDAP